MNTLLDAFKARSRHRSSARLGALTLLAGWMWAVLLAPAAPAAPPAGPPASAAQPAPASAAGPTADDAARRLMVLGAGDSVSVEVYGQPDMNTTTYVGDDGSINLPLVGAVRIAGRTPVQAAAEIERALRDGKFFVNPSVNLTIVQSRSQRVSILGEVHQPGRYPVEPNTGIFELLAQAGGVTDNAGDVAVVTRHDAAGHASRFEIGIGAGGRGADAASATALNAGDEVFVPHAARFYIYGEVNSPSMYRLERGMSVIQAIARAGGITPRGSERRIEIKRADKDGKFHIVRARPGDPVEPDDVIRVKEAIF